MDDSVSFPPPITVSSPLDDATSVEAVTTDTSVLWSEFNKFYTQNEKTIEKWMKTDVRSIALDEMDRFLETTKVVLDGLARLGKIHHIGAAVDPFHVVIWLNLLGTDNDWKLLAIMPEMQNMICTMFQLRHLKNTHIQESEGDAEKSPLYELIESITAEIFQSEGDLHFSGPKSQCTPIKTKICQQALKTLVKNFASTIAVYITAFSPIKQSQHVGENKGLNTTKLQDNDNHFSRPTHHSSHKTWMQDPEHGKWASTASHEDNGQNDGALTPALRKAAFAAKHMGPPVWPGRKSPLSAGILTNAHVGAIYDGTFVNVAHNYVSDSGPAFPIAMLGLQAVSFATRSHYPYYDHLSNSLHLSIPEPILLTPSLVLRLPPLYQDMRNVIGPVAALWFLIKMLIGKRRSTEHH